MASNIKKSTLFRSVLYRTGQIQRHCHFSCNSRNTGLPPISGRLRNRSRCHRNHRFFQPPHRYGNISAIIQHKSLTKDELSTIPVYRMDRHRNQHLVFAASWMIADYYESEILGHCVNCCPLIYSCLATIVPGALFYPEQGIQIHRYPSFDGISQVRQP